jgi:BNR repeat-containing family member
MSRAGARSRAGLSRGRGMALALVLLVAVASPVWARPAPHHHPAPARAAVRAAAQSSFGSWGHGAWSWFGDPRAVYVAGQYQEIFVGWIDWTGKVTVGAYDPAFGLMSRQVIGSLFHDDHSAPSIFVEPDHRLTVFWSGHDGTRMYYRSTLRPEDISAWGPLQRVPARMKGGLGFTYPNPVLLPSESDRLYLFWRGADWSADYATRDLAGQWQPAHEMIRVPGERPYVKVDSNGRDKIVFAFTNGHPRNVLTSVYYAAYRHGWLWTAAGRRIARMGSGPIAPQQADLVYDARKTHVRAWVWDVALDRQGRPVIVYATFPRNHRHKYWYAAWSGTRWVSHFLTVGGRTISPGTIEFEYSAGLTLDHSNPSIVYLSRQVRGGYEIERWQTPDGGTHWRHSVVVPADGTENVRPIVPRGWDSGPMRLLWLHGHYGTYTHYRTSIDYLR